MREGQTFGNYRVLARLGSGGMGAVYLAEHPLIGKRVALKIIHRELATNREVVSRFFNEARAVNRIGSEHIIQINDFGQTPEGDHFFVMEYIEGRTLAKVLEQDGVLHPRRALNIAAQIADALAAAHACAIIHRDLKPENIMLTPRLGEPDFVKVLDFGLAKMLAESSAASLTVQGVALGTPQYMAPEVCESSKTLDHRVDIYSLGVLLFEMTTGRLPFDGPSMGSILLKHVTEPPPAPRGINPAIPPSIEQVILRCLAKPPDARFASMVDVRQALLDPDRYLAGGPPVMPAASPMAPGAHGDDPAQPWHGMGSMSAAPLNQTMPIEPPAGYRPVPPSNRWPLALALAVAAAVVGAVVVALALTAGDEGPGDPAGAGDLAAAPPAPARDASPPPPMPDRSSQVRPDPAPVPETVTIRLVTRPPGAQVFDVDDNLLGETPTEISLPRAEREHLLVFRHPRARERHKAVSATGDATLELELELIETRTRRPEPRPRRPQPHDPDIERPGRDLDIMAPDF